MPQGYDGLPNFYTASSNPITANLGLSLKGCDPIVAENFYLVDTAFGSGGTSVEVNGSVVNSPNFNGTTPSAPVGNVNVIWQVSGSSVSAYVPAIATSGKWSDLQNATGALTLANAGYATTFNQTSAVNWTWANTTAAVHLTSQSSPILNLNGTVYNGAISITDGWTIQNVIGNTDNGTSTLTIAHTGSTGIASVALPSISTSPQTGGNVQWRLTNNESGTFGDDLFTVESAEINNLGGRPLGYSGNVGVTNGSTSVTAVTGTFEYYVGGSYSNSPWTGLNITIAGVNYKIAVVTSTGALTLVKPYAGSTGTVAAVVTFNGLDLYDHVMQWGYNQGGSGGYDNPALQFAYHWALESNWTGQDPHDAVMERHQALSLPGYGQIIEKRTDYGQGWQTGYNNPPGFFQDFHAKDLEVWQQVFAIDTTGVQVSAGPVVTLFLSNPNLNQLVTVGAEVNLSGFTNASNLWLNGQTANVASIGSNYVTLSALTSIPGAYGPAADYVTLGPFLDYMSTSVTGLAHKGNIQSDQSVIAGAVSVAAYANSNGPGNGNSYDPFLQATTYYDNSGGALPACGSGTPFNIGSTYITSIGQKYDAVSGNVWVRSGTGALNSIGTTGAGIFANPVYTGTQPDIDIRPGSQGGIEVYSSYTDSSNNAGFIMSPFGKNGASYYAIGYNRGTPAGALSTLILGGWSGVSLDLRDGATSMIAGDGSGNPTIKNNANFTGQLRLNGGATSGHVLRGNGTSYVDAQLAYGDLSGTPSLATIATSGKWSDLQNATGALTLANAGNATTFNQTSAVNWIWANTTAAINTTSLPAIVASGSTPTGSTGVKTVIIDTTGATLLVAVISNYSARGTIQDSLGNTWNYLTTRNSNLVIAYAYSHAGGALATGSTTFTLTPTGNWAHAVIYAVSNTLTTAGVFGLENGSNGGASPISVGSISPSAGDIVFAAFGCQNAGGVTGSTISVDSGLTSPVLHVDSLIADGSAYSLGVAGGAINPAFTTNATNIVATAIASFKPAIPVITNQSSPIINLIGTYWNGSASAADSWTIQDAIGAGISPPSTLVLAHTGTSGTAVVQVPSQINFSTDTGISRLGAASLAIGNGTAGDFTGSLQLTTLTLAGLIGTYNGVATVKQGVAPILAAPTRLTSQTAAQSAVSLVASALAGMYQIAYVASVTTASDISSVLGGSLGFQVTFTDPQDSVAKTSNPTTPTISAGNTTGTTISGVVNAYCKAGTALTYSFGYTDSHTSTAMAYNIAVYVTYYG